MKPKQQDITFYLFFGAVTYTLICLIALHTGTALYYDPSLTILEALTVGLETLSYTPFDVVWGHESFSVIGGATLVFVFIILFVWIDAQRNHHDLSGIESGSAKWNIDLKKYNKEFTDPHNSDKNDGPNNLILTQNVFLDMNTRNTQRNNNVVIIGGSGSGKSRFYVKPNILQANANYVITDPAGELLESTGKFLEDSGYQIKVFNLIEMSKSNSYNPFHYIRDDQGVIMMINCLIKNTNPKGQGSGDPFWEKSETALLQALCFYLIHYRPVEERNFTSVMRLLRAAEINENNPNAKSKLDRIFDEVEARDPHSIALKQYKTFKMGAGKTLKSILISCSVRLTVFNLTQIENLTRVDNIHLEELGGTNPECPKQALFVIIPAADNTFNFLVSMMYSQLFETLYYIAAQCKGQRLPQPVRFLLDEFANIGQIPDFTQKLSTMRKHEISCNIVLQNLAQIKTMYKDDWETIIGNSDSCLFLGGQEYSTLEYLSKELGDQTITVRDRSHSQGKSGSSSKSFKQTSRKLMMPDELGKMNNKDCVLMIRGLDPFYGRKYDYTKHPNYKYTGDANAENAYVNKINNMVGPSKESLEQGYATIKSQAFTRATKSTNPRHRIMSEMMSPESFVQAFSLTNCSDLFKRFVFISSDEIGIANPEIMQNNNILNAVPASQSAANTDVEFKDKDKDKNKDAQGAHQKPATEQTLKEESKTTINQSSNNNSKTSTVAKKQERPKQEKVSDSKHSNNQDSKERSPQKAQSPTVGVNTDDVDDFFFN